MPHPNRSKAAPRADANPTPQEVRDYRAAAGLSQSEAAGLILGTTRGWQGYETDPPDRNHRRMHPGLWMLFRARTALLKLDAPKLAIDFLKGLQ